MPDGGVDVTDGGSLNHQLAGGVDLDCGLGVLYLGEKTDSGECSGHWT